jgi:cytochrome bd-type quinol oxidase subunit 2
VIIPAVYFPILVMLLGLVFRGVAFEFRFRDAENRSFWDHVRATIDCDHPLRRIATTRYD